MQDFQTIDLQPIILKMHEAEPYSLSRVEKIAQAYLEFIFLAQKVAFPIMPSKEVDIFWHYHILNTKHYREFCDKHFGRFIDHIPLLKQEAKQSDNTAFLKTQAAFKKHYGHYIPNLKPPFYEKIYHALRIFLNK